MRFTEDGAPAILDGSPEVFVTPCPTPRRIVWRADDVRRSKRVPIAKLAVPHRLHHHASMPAKKPGGRRDARRRSLVDDLATRDVNKIAFSFIRFQFAGADQSLGGGRQRALITRTSATAQHLIEEIVVAIQSVGSSARAAPIDCVNFHPEGAHQPRRRDPDIAEAENTADATAQHSVGAMLVESPLLKVGAR